METIYMGRNARMEMFLRRVSLLFTALTLIGGLMPGQTSRGTVTGLVTDPQNASIPGATVHLTGLATNVTRTTQTNKEGLFRFDAVDPADYKLEVKASGFKSRVASRFSVGAAEVSTQDAPLEIGDVSQILEVREQTVLLRSDSPVRGGTIEETPILNLPYQTRNPFDLALTVAGVVSNKFAAPAGPGSVSYVVNGARGRSNNFMIDGTDNNDISVAGQTFNIKNPGSVAEVSIQTTNYDSEFGRAGGAVVNLITKSGTNRLHGAMGMVLDSTWDDAISSSLSHDPAIVARGHNLPGTDQQFDGTLGGPIIRDKTFYNLSYLEERQFSTSSTQMVSPTAAGRATLLALFPKGANTNADLLQQITAGYDGITNTFPVALGNGRPDIQFGQLITPWSQSLRVRQYGAKIDHHFNNRDILSGRVLIDDEVQPNGGETLSFPSFITGNSQKTVSISAYETHVFSSSITNEFRPGYTRFNLDYPLNAANPLARTLPQIIIAGINTTSTGVYGVRSTFPQGRIFNNYVLQDTMSITRGKHNVRFGVDLMDQRARQLAPFNSRGRLSYGASSGAQPFTGLANFLDNFGGAGSATIAFGNAGYYPSLIRQSYFVQDRWRATPALSVSVGLRFEYYGTPMNTISNPVFTGLFNVNPVTLDSPLYHANKVAPDKNNWAPSVGLAYAPATDSGWLGKLLGNRKSVFRMGYGVGYDSYYNNITSNMLSTAPSSISPAVTSSISAADPRGLANFSALLPAVPPPFTAILSQTSVYGNLRNPYYQRWSAGIERELGSGILLDVSYVGSKGTRLYLSEDLNPAVPSNLRAPVPADLNPSAPALQPLLDPLQGSRLVRTNGGSSSYESLQLEVKRRFANGFGITTAYTFSKAIDNGSEVLTFGNTNTLLFNSVPSLFGGLQVDKAVSSFDHPHRLVLSWEYELPVMRAQRGPLGHIIGGWNIMGITAYESGTAFSVLNGQDADGLGGAAYDRPNFNPRGAPGVRALPSTSSPTGYINPDASSAPIDPGAARYIGIAANSGPNAALPGNLGRNTERSPGLRNWDVNFVKTTRISERFSVELRAEFYNIWNTPMWGTVSISPFAPPQSSQGIQANVFSSPAGQFLNPAVVDGGGRVIRYQFRLHF